MIRLIVADMDGTLLNNNHELHPDFWKIEQELFNNNILFAVASGRQYYNLEANFIRLKNRMIFFAENGTHVVHKGKELYVNPLDLDAARGFIELGRTLKGIDLVLCGKNCAYVENKDEKFGTEIKKYYERLKYVKDLTTVEDTILKVTICDWNGVEENSFHYFKKYQEDFKVAIAARVFLDITSKTANKGNAIIKVQEKLNISPEETLVFGDYLNDLEMMQNAGHSYAMKNAHPDIIKASKFVTELDNNENGVLETIRSLNLIKTEVVEK